MTAQRGRILPAHTELPRQKGFERNPRFSVGAGSAKLSDLKTILDTGHEEHNSWSIVLPFKF